MNRANKAFYSLEELAETTSAKLVGDPKHCITGVADLESATHQDASFLANPRYMHAMQESKAGVIFVDAQIEPSPGRNFLVSNNPSQAFQKVIELFFSAKDSDSGFKGIHPTAFIHPEAILGKDTIILPYAVVSKGVKIGDHTQIGAGVYLGAFTEIGDNCIIYPNVVIREHCKIGNRVVIQAGAVIGSCGFGFTTDEKGVHVRLTQTGIVIIEDDVDIGANTVIDRARFSATRICRGTKIDNLVQIAHGVHLGENNLIIAQTGISGSSKTGKHVILAGQTGVVGHIKIADQTMVAAQSGVSKSLLKPGEKYMGTPAVPVSEHHRQYAYLKNIKKYIKKIEELEKRIKNLEDQ